MPPAISLYKVGCGEDFDVETTEVPSLANENLFDSSRGLSLPSMRGPLHMKSISGPQFTSLEEKCVETEDSTRSKNVKSRKCSGIWGFITAKLVPSASTLLQLLFAAVLCVCLLWSIWLIFLNISPNYTVNRVMNTADFDNGVFWLFVDPPPLLRSFSVAGLSIVGAGYIFILGIMVFRPKPKAYQALYCAQSTTVKTKTTKAASDRVNAVDKISQKVTSSAKYVVNFATTDSVARRLTKIGMKLFDLAFETVLLIQILEAGSPAPIIAIFTIVIVSNALVCAVIMFLSFQRIGLIETVNDLLFDLLIVVGCPMLVLLYCLSTFNFPRDKFAVNSEIFPPGWFESQASVVADPAQTAVIYKSLKSLRISSVVDWFARMGVHTTLFLRLRQLVKLIHDPQKQRIPVYPSRHRPAAVIFVVYAILLLVFVEESVRTSAVACEEHPECVVYARRWTFVDSGSLTQCPCLMMIDRDIAPKSYAEWDQPLNVTDKVAQLATTGDLQALQLTNRFLPVLPEELEKCTNMRHMILEYTHTQTLPGWIKKFSKLEFLHLESKFTSPFVVLPDDMFQDMSSLTFLHFAGFIPMQRLPSFEGLTNLKSLILAVFLMLEEIPSFDTLHKLERLLVTCIPSLDRLPDFAPIRQLKSLILTDRGSWCCNGFLGECNLDHPMCQLHPLWGTPPATCLPADSVKTTPETLAMMKKYPENVCTGLLLPGTLEGPPTPDGMNPCNGTLYRQCIDPSGLESMCYNARFMGIACDTNPFPIRMRRRQIEKGVGDPCDPEYEAWLGCK